MTYNFVLQLLQILIPLLAVVGLVYLMLKNFREKEDKQFLMELRKSTHNQTFPIRLQAYERLILLLERIDLTALVTRLSKDTNSAGQLHLMMMMTVQQEFEHNLAQQLYVSPAVWNKIMAARNETLHTISAVFDQGDQQGSNKDLAQAIFAYLQEHPPEHLINAKSALKSEIGLFLQ